MWLLPVLLLQACRCMRGIAGVLLRVCHCMRVVTCGLSYCVGMHVAAFALACVVLCI